MAPKACADGKEALKDSYKGLNTQLSFVLKRMLTSHSPLPSTIRLE